MLEYRDLNLILFLKQFSHVIFKSILSVSFILLIPRPAKIGQLKLLVFHLFLCHEKCRLRQNHRQNPLFTVCKQIQISYQTTWEKFIRSGFYMNVYAIHVYHMNVYCFQVFGETFLTIYQTLDNYGVLIVMFI